MGLEHFIGLEAEFVSFDKRGQRVSFKDTFTIKGAKSFYNDKKKRRIFITKKGLSFYADGLLIETNTVPLALGKGVSTGLINILNNSLDEIIRATPNCEHSGYSMHWNLTFDYNKRSVESFYRGIIVPFSLFGLSPVSKGMNVRNKGTLVDRIEVLGDFINNEKQLQATALLLSAYSLAMSNEDRLPFQMKIEGVGGNTIVKNFLKGRESRVRIQMNNAEHEITAQQYLMLFRKWLDPYIRRVGNSVEVRNLDDFIYGRQQLEFDKKVNYNYIRENGLIQNGMYLPIGPLQVRRWRKLANLPYEAQLVGAFITKFFNGVKKFDWNHIDVSDGQHQFQYMGNVRGMYDFLSERTGRPEVSHAIAPSSWYTWFRRHTPSSLEKELQEILQANPKYVTDVFDTSLRSKSPQKYTV